MRLGFWDKEHAAGLIVAYDEKQEVYTRETGEVKRLEDTHRALRALQQRKSSCFSEVTLTRTSVITTPAINRKTMNMEN